MNILYILLYIIIIIIKLSFLSPLFCPFTTPPIQLFVFIPRTSSINIRACSRHAAHNSVASLTSMHSFTSMFKVSRWLRSHAAVNGNILLVTGQWMVPPWLFLLVCRILLLEQHAPNITIIEVYHSLFNTRLWTGRHAVVLNRNFVIA